MNERNNCQCSKMIRRILFIVLISVSALVFLMYAVLRIADYKGKKIYNELESVFYSHGFDGDILEDIVDEKDGISKVDVGSNASAETNNADSSTDGYGNDTEMTEDNDSEYQAMMGAYRSELLEMREGILALAQINPDVYGWIRIPGTVIDYPIVQGSDNEYYLNFSYTNEYLPAGSIFVDYRCEKIIDNNYNTIFFGHNAEQSGTMFHDLEKFLDEDFFAETYIYIYTMDGVYIYEPFSIYTTRADYNYFRTEFDDVDDFDEFVREMRKNTNVRYDGNVSDVKNIITLSTCTNGASNIRYALHAKLIKKIMVTYND